MQQCGRLHLKNSPCARPSIDSCVLDIKHRRHTTNLRWRTTQSNVVHQQSLSTRNCPPPTRQPWPPNNASRNAHTQQSFAPANTNLCSFVGGRLVYTKRCTFRDAEHLACTICPLMTHMPVLSMNNVQTSEHVSLKLHPVYSRWPRKKGFGSRPGQNANDKRHERAKNGGGRVNRRSGHMSKEQDAQKKSLADSIGHDRV